MSPGQGLTQSGSEGVTTTGLIRTKCALPFASTSLDETSGQHTPNVRDSRNLHPQPPAPVHVKAPTVHPPRRAHRAAHPPAQGKRALLGELARQADHGPCDATPSVTIMQKRHLLV